MVEESLQHAIKDSGAPFVLCFSEFRDKVRRSMEKPDSPASHSPRSQKTVALEAAHPIWKTGDISDPGIKIRPHDGAYVIYTSGTNGKPEGKDIFARLLRGLLFSNSSLP